MEKYNLKDLVLGLGSPMSEDQVWALCFKTTKEMRLFYNEIRRQPMVYEPPNLGSVVFLSDGDIFSLTVTPEREAGWDFDIEKAREEMVCEIGQLLLEAMRVTGREEFSPTSTLQALLLRMVRPSNRPSFKEILLACRKEVKLNANIHYDLVVKHMIFQYVHGDKLNSKTDIEVKKFKNNMENMAKSGINSEVLPSHLQHPDADGVSVKTKSEAPARQVVQHQKDSHGENKETFLRNLIKKIVDEALVAALTSFTMHTASREYYVKIMGETIAKESLVQVTQYFNSAGDSADKEMAVKLLLEAFQKAMEYNRSCDYSKLQKQLEKNMDSKLKGVTVPIHEFHESAKLGKDSGSPCLYTDTIDHRESEDDKDLDGAICMKDEETNEHTTSGKVGNVICSEKEHERIETACNEEDEERIDDFSIENEKDEKNDKDLCCETHENVEEDRCNAEVIYDDIYADDVVGMAVYMLHCY